MRGIYICFLALLYVPSFWVYFKRKTCLVVSGRSLAVRLGFMWRLQVREEKNYVGKKEGRGLAVFLTNLQSDLGPLALLKRKLYKILLFVT